MDPCFEAAGAISLGKFALCEGSQAPYHPELQIPVNPWDETRWSGVSSSGSGVATAAGLCFGSIGIDPPGTVEAALAHRAAFPQKAAEYGPGCRCDLEYGLQLNAVDYARATQARAEISGTL